MGFKPDKKYGILIFNVVTISTLMDYKFGGVLMGSLKKGDRVPAFMLTDQFGKNVKPGDFKGKKVLLYFFPKAGTSG